MLVFWENDDVILNFGLERLLMMLAWIVFSVGPATQDAVVCGRMRNQF